MGHSDFKATKPGRQSLSVSGQVTQERVCERRVADGSGEMANERIIVKRSDSILSHAKASLIFGRENNFATETVIVSKLPNVSVVQKNIFPGRHDLLA